MDLATFHQRVRALNAPKIDTQGPMMYVAIAAVVFIAAYAITTRRKKRGTK